MFLLVLAHPGCPGQIPQSCKTVVCVCKRTADAIFIVRQMQENFGSKGKKLYFGFVDLEKAFDRVPREVIWWAMHKLGVEEWLVSAVMSMYTGAKTVVRTVMVLR